MSSGIGSAQRGTEQLKRGHGETRRWGKEPEQHPHRSRPHSSTCPAHRCGEPAPAPGCPRIPRGGTPGTSECCWEFCHWEKRGGEQGTEGWGEQREQGGSGGRGRQFSLIWANPLPAKRSQKLTKKNNSFPGSRQPGVGFLQLHGHGESCGQPWGEAVQEQGNTVLQRAHGCSRMEGSSTHQRSPGAPCSPTGSASARSHSQPAARACSPHISRCEAPSGQMGTAPWGSTASFSAPSSLRWEAESQEKPRAPNPASPGLKMGS